MEDQENNETINQYEEKRKQYEDELKKKILLQKQKNEANLREIDRQYKKIMNLPEYERNELISKVYYWYLTGACYFVMGFFYFRRPRKLWKRILFWVPSLIFIEGYVTSHYFWSVKDKDMSSMNNNNLNRKNENETKENNLNLNNDSDLKEKEKFEADKIDH